MSSNCCHKNETLDFETEDFLRELRYDVWVCLFDRDRLIANDFIQIRKVIEHVYEKVLGVLDNNAYSAASSVNGVGASTPAGSVPTPTGPSPSTGSTSLNQTSGSSTTVVTPNSDKGLPGSAVSSTTVDRQETGSIAEDKVELLCNEQVYPPSPKYQHWELENTEN